MSAIAPSSNRSPSSDGLIRDAFWPNLKRRIQHDPSTLEKLRIDCPICYDKMDTDVHTQPGHLQSSQVLHSPYVAPCGHIFGAQCFRQLLSGQNYRGKCPLCSLPWKHSNCNHPNKGCRLQTLVNRLDGGPQTFLEGGKLLKDCAKCTVKIWAESLLQQAETILNQRELTPDEKFEVAVYNGAQEVYNSARRLNIGAQVLKCRDVDIGETAEKMVKAASTQLAEICESNWWDMAADELVVEIKACKWVAPWRDLQMAVLQAIREDGAGQAAPAGSDDFGFSFFDDRNSEEENEDNEDTDEDDEMEE